MAYDDDELLPLPTGPAVVRPRLGPLLLSVSLVGCAGETGDSGSGDGTAVGTTTADTAPMIDPTTQDDGGTQEGSATDTGTSGTGTATMTDTDPPPMPNPTATGTTSADDESSGDTGSGSDSGSTGSASSDGETTANDGGMTTAIPPMPPPPTSGE